MIDNNSPDGSADLVAQELPQTLFITNRENFDCATLGYPAANNQDLHTFGYPDGADAPRFALLLNPDTEFPPDGLAKMLVFIDVRPDVGVAGPRLNLPDGSLDLTCQRAFLSPES